MNAMHSSISRRAMLSVAALLLCLGSTEAAPLFVPQKTHAVVIGVLKFRDPGLRSFSAIGRKDKELYELLLKRGVPAKQATLLLDEQATRQGVDKALAQAIGRVKAGETLIVYYAGHGVIYGTGDVAFATYDLTRQNLAGTGLLMSNLSTALARLPKGARVILLADCCYSGRMQRVAREISRLGVESVSLTSADASNYSSGNWTYTQAIIDGLSGAPLADLDNDGQVQLDELAREVKRAMKYRERQKHGFSVHGVKPRLVVSQRKGSALVRGKGPYTIGAYARTKRAGKWETVRIVGRRGPSVQVEYYDYYRKVRELKPLAEVKPIRYQRYPVGSKILVAWNNSPYTAVVQRVDGDFHWIHYPGWAAYWDEWILSPRIVPTEVPTATSVVPIGTRVWVFWGKKWWRAELKKRQGERFFIHYVRFDNSWDEWVTPARIRVPKAPNAPRANHR